MRSALQTDTCRVEEPKPHILVGVTSSQTCLVLLNRLRALREKGFRVSVLSGPGELLQQVTRLAGVSAYAIPIRRTFSPITDLRAFLQICRLLLKLKPDMVEFSTPKMGLLGSVAAWFCRIRVRVYFLRGLRLEAYAGLKRKVLLWAEYISSACASVVLCNSRSLMDRVASLGIAGPPKLFLLGDGSSNGVDVVRFSPGESDIRDRFAIPPAAKVIGFVGRLTADKGLPELIEAFARILSSTPEAHLLLVGWFDAAEDALECSVRARIEGHPRMTLTGYVADVAPYYRAMDVLALPSWREGFPNAILEAGASGIPVVATACTGSTDAVLPGVTGLLTPPGDPRRLAEAITGLLANSEARKKMGDSARQWVMKHYRSTRVLELAVRFYENLLTH